MKKEIKSFNITWCFVAIALLTQSCVSLVRHEKMQLKSDNNSPSLFKLRNYGEQNDVLLVQSENLTNGHLFKSNGAEYGYYILNYKTEQVKIPIGAITGMFFFLIPYGLPTSGAGISLQANLYIFDSQGQLIKEYEEEDYFTQTAGLYYGHNPTKKAAKKYTRLYEKVFEFATLQKDKINEKLLKSGPITKENEAEAKANIEAFFKGRKESYAKIAKYKKIQPVSPENMQNIPTPGEILRALADSYYAEPQIETLIRPIESSSGSFDFNILNGGLEAGKYYCTIDRSLQLKIALRMIILSKNGKDVAAGSYDVSGNKLIVRFFSGEGYTGKTFVYVIDDAKNFHREGSNEYWMHEGIY